MKVGDKFGRWTVIGEPFKGKVLARCECGTKRMVQVDSLRRGGSKSCGCLRTEQRTTHGRCHTRLYRTWQSMFERCKGYTHKDSKNYTKRGITVCDEWSDPEVFCRWAEANGYRNDLTIDRIDGTKGYTPQNCHFTTYTVQSENRRKQSNNISGFIGVSWYERYQRWKATGVKDKKPIHLGYFDNPKEAAKVRDSFVKKHYTSPTLNFV